MKINNSRNKARWEYLICKCGTDVLNSFPIKECLHCSFDQRWQSVPKENFKVNEDIIKNGKVTKKQTRLVKEITLVRGERFEDVIGWTF